MDLTGTTVDGKYQLIRELGAGGMGKVYVARHLELGREVALKMLLPDVALEHKSKQRFEREARLLSLLQCAHVVTYLGWGVWHDRSPYLVMELLEGRSVAALLNERNILDWREACQIAIQACRGLESIHSQKIVHRDLSVANLFICDLPAGHLKIIDMGLASRPLNSKMDTLTETGALIGSLHYMSPEVCRGEVATEASDIYSLGCILYELITGNKCFDGDTPMGVIYKHANEYPVPVNIAAPDAQVSEFVQNIIFHAIQKQAVNRYSTAAHLRKDLESALNGTTRPGLRSWSESSINARGGRGRFWMIATSVVFTTILICTSLSYLKQHGPSNSATSIRKKHFNPATEPITTYISSAIKERVPPLVIEEKLEEWIAFRPERSTPDYALHVADGYLALADGMINDQPNMYRVLNLAQKHVAAFVPRGAKERNNQVEKDNEVLWKLAYLGHDDKIAIESARKIFASLQSCPQSLSQRKLHALLSRCVYLGAQTKDFRWALENATVLACDRNIAPYSRIWTAACIALMVPPSYEHGAKFSLIEKFVKCEEGKEHGKAIWGNNDDSTVNGMLMIVETCATEGRPKLAKSVLDLYFELFSPQSSGGGELKKLLELYNQPYKEENTKRIVALTDEFRANDIRNSSLLREALRLAILYPATVTEEVQPQEQASFFLNTNKLFVHGLNFEKELDALTMWKPVTANSTQSCFEPKKIRLQMSKFYLRSPSSLVLRSKYLESLRLLAQSQQTRVWFANMRSMLHEQAASSLFQKEATTEKLLERLALAELRFEGNSSIHK
jgi:serine/threonine protein kinase